MSNSLINERSPYLLEHAGNPVDWYPWCSAAFEKAAAEDKPVFLSIGYSTCHWCHVMARESFEDEQVAAVLNGSYVSVKVDREERPDVDAVYMEACTALNGSGGWPLTVFMTAEGLPFFVCTYLPRDSRGRQMGLLPLLRAVADKWVNDRQSLLCAGEEIRSRLLRQIPVGSACGDMEQLRRGAEQLISSLDRENGGFGGAPKFPAPHNYLFLLRYAALSGDKQCRAAAELGLRQMYRGGIFDHIGGGFSRYSTDSRWLVPHFEKTLYDNALLAMTYAEAYQEGRLPLYRRVAERTLDYCMSELLSPEGAFYSGQDADSGGVEGAYYLLRPDEVCSVLGADEGRHFCECYDISEQGHFQGGSIPNLLSNQRWQFLPEGYDRYRQQLLDFRRSRLPLKTDTKLIPSWNGLMLMALSRAALAFNSSRYLSAALRLAGWFERRDKNGQVTGVNGLPATLSDLAFPALGLLELYRVSLDPVHCLRSEALAEEIVRHFSDGSGGYYMTSDSHEKLLKRSMELYDGALPSGSSGAAVLFDLLRRMTGKEKWRKACQDSLDHICARSAEYPAGCAFALTGLLGLVYPTRELVCVSDTPPDALDTLNGKYAPELSLLFLSPDTRQSLGGFAPFTRGMMQKDGKPTFYLCSGGVCSLPFTVE